MHGSMIVALNGLLVDSHMFEYRSWVYACNNLKGQCSIDFGRPFSFTIQLALTDQLYDHCISGYSDETAAKNLVWALWDGQNHDAVAQSLVNTKREALQSIVASSPVYDDAGAFIDCIIDQQIPVIGWHSDARVADMLCKRYRAIDDKWSLLFQTLYSGHLPNPTQQDVIICGDLLQIQQAKQAGYRCIGKNSIDTLLKDQQRVLHQKSPVGFADASYDTLLDSITQYNNLMNH